jgi:hypothetical protein
VVVVVVVVAAAAAGLLWVSSLTLPGPIRYPASTSSAPTLPYRAALSANATPRVAALEWGRRERRR